MSSDQSSVNAQTVEQTKQQIRSLVGEIAQLSKSDVNAEEYYAAFMQRIVSALAAVGGAVWLVGEARRPELAYQINLSESLLLPGSADAKRHLRLLNYIVPDKVHVMVAGRVITTGPKELAMELDQKGYEWVRETYQPAAAQ